MPPQPTQKQIRATTKLRMKSIKENRRRKDGKRTNHPDTTKIRQYGEEHPRAHLSNKDIRMIRFWVSCGQDKNDIARKYETTRRYINDIIRGDRRQYDDLYRTIKVEQHSRSPQ